MSPKRALQVFLSGGCLWLSMSGCAPSVRVPSAPKPEASALSRSWVHVRADQVKWRLGMLSTRVVGGGPVLEWSAASADLAFDGVGLRVEAKDLGDSRWSECSDNVLEVVVDGRDTIDHVVDPARPMIEIGPLADGPHTLRVSKRTEALCGRVGLGDVAVHGGSIQAPPAQPQRRILYIGGSVTCGWGVMDDDPSPEFRPGSQSGTASYAAEAAKRLGADYGSVCVSGRGLLWNHDRRTDDVLPQVWRQGSLQRDEHNPLAKVSAPDAVVLELGQLELQQDIPDAATFTRTYVEFVMEIHRRWPEAWIVALDAPALDDERLATLRSFLLPVDQWVRSRYKVKNFSRLFLTQQGALGYGGGGFPNRSQSVMNGEELADHLRSRLGWKVAQR